jgi:cytochrome c
MWGVLFLLTGLFFFAAANAKLTDPLSWQENESFVGLIVSASVWLKYIQYLSMALGMTGFGLLYFLSQKIRTVDEESADIYIRDGIHLSVSALIILPIIILLNLAGLSNSALSGTVYVFIGIAFGIMFLAGHFLYISRNNSMNYSTAYGYFLFLIASILMLTADSISIGYASRDHAAVLADRHTQDLLSLKEKLGVSIVTFTGEDIYNAKCSACHLVNQKKVGPPYSETIPKYRENKSALVAFILNPVKVNQAYPSMPNQGLKPAEADSVASYIIQQVAMLNSKSSK